MNPVKYIRIVNIRNRASSVIVREDVIRSYITTGLALQPDIPNMLVVFTEPPNIDFMEGMSLFALRPSTLKNGVFIVQHNNGNLRDFDYETYGQLITEVVTWEHDKVDKKSTNWPIIAPALTETI